MISRTKYADDLHFRQRCEWNLYKDIAECLFDMIRGKGVNIDKLKTHYEILNYLHLSGIIESNHYDNLVELLDSIIQFFTP